MLNFVMTGRLEDRLCSFQLNNLSSKTVLIISIHCSTRDSYCLKQTSAKEMCSTPLQNYFNMACITRTFVTFSSFAKLKFYSKNILQLFILQRNMKSKNFVLLQCFFGVFQGTDPILFPGCYSNKSTDVILYTAQKHHSLDLLPETDVRFIVQIRGLKTSYSKRQQTYCYNRMQ